MNERNSQAGNRIAGTILGLALALPAVAAPALAQPEPPRLEVDRLEINVGDVPRGERPEVSFALRNDGGSVLRVLDVQPACACTVASYDAEILPGGRGQLSATLDTAGYKGSLRRSIRLETNDPARPVLTLVVGGRIQVSADVLPGPEIYIRPRPGRRSEARRLVRQDESETGQLDIGDIQVSAEWLDARAQRIDEPRPAGRGLPAAEAGDWEILVTVAEQRTYGDHAETVSFATGLNREPRITLPVFLELGTPPVNLADERLEMARDAKGAAHATTVLSVRQGLDPLALIAEAQPPELQVRLESAGGRMFRLYVDWAGPEAGQGRVSLRLGAESVTLPVQWQEAAPVAR